MTTLELSRDQALEKSVVSKVLVRLVPFLAILYLFNLMDRGNVSIAALTMKKDLTSTTRSTVSAQASSSSAISSSKCPAT